jgi:hypothetical protein
MNLKRFLSVSINFKVSEILSFPDLFSQAVSSKSYNSGLFLYQFIALIWYAAYNVLWHNTSLTLTFDFNFFKSLARFMHVSF